MANTLTNYLPKWLAAGLDVLRKNAVMPMLVNNDFSMNAAAKGDYVNIPVASTLSASNVTPGVTPATPSDLSPTNVQIALDKWKYVKFHLTDKELTQINAGESFVPNGINAAIRALAEQVNSDLFATYSGIYGYTGTAGTAPFGTDVSDLANARKILNQQLAPLSDRRLVIDPVAEAEALQLSAFTEAQKIGDATAIREGFLGRLMGFDIHMDQQVPLHTGGTLSDGDSANAKVNGALSVGDTSVDLDETTLTGTLVAGDIISFAGHDQTYTVVTGGTAASNALAGVTFTPALTTAVDDNAVVTLRASHRVNLAFHKDAFAFVARPLSGGIEGFGTLAGAQVMQDPISKIPLRIQVIREWMQTSIVLDILYGVKLVRPELACRIAG
jgi:hypothetical protein